MRIIRPGKKVSGGATIWEIWVGQTLIGYVEKMRDTRTYSNPFKSFRYGNGGSRMVGTTYTTGRAGLQAAADLVVRA